MENLRLAIRPGLGAKVIPVRRVDHHLPRVARTSDQRHHVVAHDRAHLVVQRQVRGKVQGSWPEAVLCRRPGERIETLPGGCAQPGGGVMAQPALNLHLVGIAGRKFLPRSGPAVAHHLPGITRGPGVMDDEHGRSAVPRGLLVFICPATVVGHGLAVKHLRVAGRIARIVHQHHHGLAPGIQTGVVVPLEFRGDDPVANEHERTVSERHRLLGPRRVDHDVLAIGERERRATAADRQHRAGVGGDLNQRHVLQEAAVIGRPQAVALELGDDVAGGELLAGTGGRPPAEGIRGQGLDGRANVGIVELRRLQRQCGGGAEHQRQRENRLMHGAIIVLRGWEELGAACGSFSPGRGGGTTAANKRRR